MTTPRKSENTAAPALEPDFAAYLTRQAERKTKGERTRARILGAACRMLSSAPPAQLTVAGLCQDADIAHGTFYIYFPDIPQMLSDLLLSFTTYLQVSMFAASRAEPENTIRAATRIYGLMFQHNAGLMKCLLHHQDSFPDARIAFHRLNREWMETVVSATRHRLVQSGQSHLLCEAELTRRAYALGAMTDQYFSSLFLSREEHLVQVSSRLDDAVDTLSLIWKRGLQP